MNPLISIIIPSFNVERYIDKCVSSIVEQTYFNWELIIVIDGATDHTEEKAKVWESKYENILVVSQSNKGSGSARNTGLKYAKGMYVMFVDPDDWIDNMMLFEYIKEASSNSFGYDLIVSDSICDYYEGDSYLYSEKEYVNGFSKDSVEDTRKEYLNLFTKGLIRGPVCKLYKKEIIDKYSIEFPNLRRSQDIVFNCRYYKYITSVKLFDSHYYHYCCIQGKHAKKIPNDYYLALAQIVDEIFEMYTYWGMEPSVTEMKGVYNYLYNALFSQVTLGDSESEMKNIVNNASIRTIARMAKSHSIKKEIIRCLIMLKSPNLINFLVRLSLWKRKIRNINETSKK